MQGPSSQRSASHEGEGKHAASIAFFAHDSTESTVIKRVAAFQASGAQVIGFMFRRVRPKPPAPRTWDNVDLGITVDRNYAKRLPKLLVALLRLIKSRSALRRCQIFYARNIDMLLLAFWAKRLFAPRAVLAYEVLDVQRIFIGSGMISKAMRCVERYLLARCDMLVVSSPDFIARYFQPYQGFSGAWHLLENKVFAQPATLQHLQREPHSQAGPPWSIGWFGTLRCERSLDILSRIADALGDRVVIHIRGLPSSEDLTVQQIEAVCDRRTNMPYGGPYASPRDLGAIYANVHFAWCVDYLDAGLNSDWLLPNRLYEGGLMGALAIARRDTATSRKVERDDLGWTFAEPLEQEVADFIAHLDAAAYEHKRRRLAGMARSQFVDLTDTRDLVRGLESLAAERAIAPRAAPVD
jgi:succinoglycan biosynthesis protein ExoL